MQRSINLAWVLSILLGLGTVHANGNTNVSMVEIMYNPGSAEAVSEWVEIFNRGPAAARIGGWRIDDEDASGWGTIPNNTTLEVGQFAVIIDDDVSEASFRTEWSVPAGALVIAVDWAALANNPSPTNEILQLLDSANNVIDVVNYDDSGDWPGDNNASSIYLTDLHTDNAVGSSWALSVVGVDGAIHPSGPTFSPLDVASPGVPEPASLLMFFGATATILSRRRERGTRRNECGA